MNLLYLTTAKKILQDDLEFANVMQNYLEQLKKQSQESPSKAKKEAKESLTRMGVLTPDGKVKDQIVSWDK